VDEAALEAENPVVVMAKEIIDQVGCKAASTTKMPRSIREIWDRSVGR